MSEDQNATDIRALRDDIKKVAVSVGRIEERLNHLEDHEERIGSLERFRAWTRGLGAAAGAAGAWAVSSLPWLSNLFPK